jgi:molybdopterin-binding protein
VNLTVDPSLPRHAGPFVAILRGMVDETEQTTARLRVGQAAEMLGVSVETLRRWEADGRIRMERSDGGQRVIGVEEVSRLLAERRRLATDRPIVAQSARNRFAGIITRIEKDRVAAVVEVMAGPHRLVSLMTAEAVDDLGLEVGREAVCVVKATNVMVEIPFSRETRS